MSTIQTKLVPAADKTIKIIEYMAQRPDHTYGVSEIAAALGYNKGTVHPILRTLIADQWVEQDKITDKYYLTNHLAILGGQLEKGIRLVSDFLLIGNEIERECGELVNLHFLSNMTHAKLIAKVLSTAHSLRVDFPIGALIPVIASSAGKCLVCEYDDQTLCKVFHQCNNHFTLATLATQEEFLHNIHMVRQEGYATNWGEYEDGIYSVAAPIYNRQKRIIAAVNIVIPVPRYNEERKVQLISLVKKGAERLSELCRQNG